MHVDIPASVHENYRADYRCLRQMIRSGFTPDFVIDIGASTGIWSHSVVSLLPHARFYLVEPLLSRYDPEAREYMIRRHANFTPIEVALADRPGRVRIHATPDLYTSSLVDLPWQEKPADIEVTVTTLDELDRQFPFAGRGLVKIDVQHAEHLVLRGGENLIRDKVDALLVELTLARVSPEAVTFREWLGLMEERGFEYFDDAGEWRDPSTGRLLEKDILFLRRGVIS